MFSQKCFHYLFRLLIIPNTFWIYIVFCIIFYYFCLFCQCFCFSNKSHSFHFLMDCCSYSRLSLHFSFVLAPFWSRYSVNISYTFSCCLHSPYNIFLTLVRTFLIQYFYYISFFCAFNTLFVDKLPHPPFDPFLFNCYFLTPLLRLSLNSIWFVWKWKIKLRKLKNTMIMCMRLLYLVALITIIVWISIIFVVITKSSVFFLLVQFF